MDAFWRNVVRHLAQGRLQRRNDLLELTIDKNLLETGDKVRVQLRVHDVELQPAVASEQPIFLRNQKSEVEKRVLHSIPNEPGAYQSTFTMDVPGAYSFLVFATQNKDDAVLARQDLLVRIPDKAMADPSQSLTTLRRSAAARRAQSATSSTPTRPTSRATSRTASPTRAARTRARVRPGTRSGRCCSCCSCSVPSGCCASGPA